MRVRIGHVMAVFVERWILLLKPGLALHSFAYTRIYFEESGTTKHARGQGKRKGKLNARSYPRATFKKTSCFRLSGDHLRIDRSCQHAKLHRFEKLAALTFPVLRHAHLLLEIRKNNNTRVIKCNKKEKTKEGEDQMGSLLLPSSRSW